MTVAQSHFPATLASGHERRRAPRHRLAVVIRVRVGRGSGTLIDLSATGARVRHDAPLALRSAVRLCFEMHGAKFDGPGEVLASRVVSLGSGGASRYESRFNFLALSSAAEAALERSLEELEGSNLRRWVANLRGWSDDADLQFREPHHDSFVRCTFDGGRWVQKVTTSSHAPPEGFTVPANTQPAEIQLLCRTYAESDDARDMVRLVTRAVVKQPS